MMTGHTEIRAQVVWFMRDPDGHRIEDAYRDTGKDSSA
jgi:hypothetical protein